MGKAEIISDNGAGAYRIRLVIDKAIAQHTLQAFQGRVEELMAENEELRARAENEESRSDDEARDDDRQIKINTLQIVALGKKINRLQEILSLSLEQVAWCADYTEGLSGVVGTIEVAQEYGKGFNIRPGYIDGAGYNLDRDGLHVPFGTMMTAHALLNFLAMPSIQKWRPTYRYGIIGNIDTGTNKASVNIIGVNSVAQGLPVDRFTFYHDIPVQYMECNASAFEEGDRVIVQFDPAHRPTIIGFASTPKPCRGGTIKIMINGQEPTLPKRLVFEWEDPEEEEPVEMPVTSDPSTPNEFILPTGIKYPAKLYLDNYSGAVGRIPGKFGFNHELPLYHLSALCSDDDDDALFLTSYLSACTAGFSPANNLHAVALGTPPSTPYITVKPVLTEYGEELKAKPAEGETYNFTCKLLRARCKYNIQPRNDGNICSCQQTMMEYTESSPGAVQYFDGVDGVSGVVYGLSDRIRDPGPVGSTSVFGAYWFGCINLEEPGTVCGNEEYAYGTIMLGYFGTAIPAAALTILKNTEESFGDPVHTSFEILIKNKGYIEAGHNEGEYSVCLNEWGWGNGSSHIIEMVNTPADRI